MRLAWGLVVLLTGCVGNPVFIGSKSSGGGGGVGVGGGSTTSTSATNATAASGGGGGSTTTGTDSVCGNWEVEPGEGCEDGNLFPGDGCSPDCQLEAFCGNGLVEPGELCDTTNCDSMCVPDAASACYGAIELDFGNTDLTTGAPLVGLGACGASEARFTGWYDIGPVPQRVALRFQGVGETFRVSTGCETEMLTGCASPALTDLLPAHTRLWVTVQAGTEGLARSLLVFRTRYGSFFQGDGGGMTNLGGTLDWAWSATDAGIWSVASTIPGYATLITPPINLSGLDAAAVHFDTTLVPGTGGALGTVEYTVDGLSWLSAGTVPMGTDGHFELALPEAVGQPAVQVRFVYQGNADASWSMRNLFVGLPVPLP